MVFPLKLAGSRFIPFIQLWCVHIHTSCVYFTPVCVIELAYAALNVFERDPLGRQHRNLCIR